MQKIIVGFSRYSIDENGVVTNTRTNRIMKSRLNHRGYQRHGLVRDDGKQETITVHRLVALTFIDNPNDYPLIDHINENKTDNRVDNLRWCTNQMNLNYYYFGRCVHTKSKEPMMSKSEFLKSVSIPCRINGIVYPSSGSAANMISEIEGKLQRTVRKEIRRMLQGKREPWCMYGKYHIDRA